MTPFIALRYRSISLYLIDSWNLRDAEAMVCRFSDRAEIRDELRRSYAPAFGPDGNRLKWGFYARLDGEIAGLGLLGVNRDDPTVGYTGADTLVHMRGKGVAPDSKPMLFCLGFAMLGMSRIETGCHISNKCSKRSIEKTLGFEFSGVISPSPHLNSKGEEEDELRYVITREKWELLYSDTRIEVIR